MKQINLLLLELLTATVVIAQESVFLYCPGEHEGMRIAYSLEGNGNYTDIAQIFSSDYSQWGMEKRMYSPYVIETEDGGYVAVFQVNDYSPCFAVAYSVDLITWRPQDYPRMSTKNCIAPVIHYDGNGTYSVLFKDTDGNFRRTTTSSDFRHFTKDVEAFGWEYDEVDVIRDTVCVNGISCVGNVFPYNGTEKLKDYYAKIDENNRLWAENLMEDHMVYGSMGDSPLNVSISFDKTSKKDISDKLIGIFFEDINYACDGGLYAELIQNRDFEYCPKDNESFTSSTAWTCDDGKLVIGTEVPLSKNNPHYAIVGNTTIYNSGWDGIVIKDGCRYYFNLYANNIEEEKATVTISLVSGDQEMASAKIETEGEGWKQYSAELKAVGNAKDARLKLSIEGEGQLCIDMVSLFPQDTFHGHKNGLRKDLAQVLADLQPKFVRFPGGCMSHGEGLENIYHWNHTIGDLKDRKPDFNIWHSHQTRGIGFFEYFQFCEDIGAEPIPVLAAAVPCQNSAPNEEGYGGQQGGIPMEDMPAYIDELCNLIEWANGDPSTNEWAKIREEAGHPEPFNLKYLGVGNEDIISTDFEERYLMICRTLHERYPEIKIVGTAGPFHSPSSDYIEGWKIAKENNDLLYVIDEHYYESVGWFINNQDYYDDYDRSMPKVYLGEYAARSPRGNIDCALAEALYLCSIERNADIVEMTSPAPLLCNDLHHNWDPNMIYFTNDSIDLTPSYHTQRLFSVYGGDKYLSTEIKVENETENLRKRISATVVENSKSGKTFLKIVNVLPMALNLKVSAEGMSLCEENTYEGFNGVPGQERVDIRKGHCGKIVNGDLLICVDPYSLMVVEL